MPIKGEQNPFVHDRQEEEIFEELKDPSLIVYKLEKKLIFLNTQLTIY